MKKVFFVALIAMILFACNNSKGSTRPKHPARDTTVCLGIFTSPTDGSPRPDYIKRIVWDSLMYLYSDTLQDNKREWRHDTSYLVAVFFSLDSIQSRIYKKPMYDSAGKVIQYSQLVEINKKFVMSGWDKVDSASLRKIKPAL